MAELTLYLANDCYLELSGLQNLASGQYINDAVATVTLKDLAGANVTGQAWPATLAYVSGSNGVYRALLENTLNLVDGKRYFAILDVSGAGLQAHWEVEIVATVRRS